MASGADWASVPLECAANAGMVPAAPSAKLRAATAARRCVFLDKVLPFSTTGHHAGARPWGRARPSTPKVRCHMPQRGIRPGVGRFLPVAPNAALLLPEQLQGGVEGGARPHGRAGPVEVGE